MAKNKPRWMVLRFVFAVFPHARRLRRSLERALLRLRMAALRVSASLRPRDNRVSRDAPRTLLRPMRADPL